MATTETREGITASEAADYLGGGRPDSKKRRWFQCPVHRGSSKTSAWIAPREDEEGKEIGVTAHCTAGCSGKELYAEIELAAGGKLLRSSGKKYVKKQLTLEEQFPIEVPPIIIPDTFLADTKRMVAAFKESEIDGWEEAYTMVANRHACNDPSELYFMVGLIPPLRTTETYGDTYAYPEWQYVYMMRYPNWNSPAVNWKVCKFEKENDNSKKLNAAGRTIPPYSVFRHKNTTSKNTIWLVEGEGDALSIALCGEIAIASSSSGNLNKAAAYSARLCAANDLHLVLLGDNDAASRLGEKTRNVGGISMGKAHSVALKITDRKCKAHFVPRIEEAHNESGNHFSNLPKTEQEAKDPRQYALDHGLPKLKERLAEIKAENKIPAE